MRSVVEPFRHTFFKSGTNWNITSFAGAFALYRPFVTLVFSRVMDLGDKSKRGRIIEVAVSSTH